MLLSWANIAFYQDLMAAARAAIAEGRYAAFLSQHRDRVNAPEPPEARS
jgi:queuine tRNA-ribosyltransferase